LGIAFAGIPFYTLAKYEGMAEAVRSLRAAGILDRLRMADPSLLDIGDVTCPAIKSDKGPSNLHNFEAFLEGTRRVREKLIQGADPSKLTFLLGGECAFIVGSLAALKTKLKVRPGVVWMDAHGDFNTPETSPSGFIGGMALALACGRGPRLSPEIEASRPLLNEKQVVHVGSRSLDPEESESVMSSLKVFSAKDVKKNGARHVAREIADYLASSCDWIVFHLDADVLDPSVMPAADFPEPGGLTGSEVVEIVRSLRETGKLKVVDMTAYNPRKDANNVGKTFLLDLTPKLVSST